MQHGKIINKYRTFNCIIIMSVLLALCIMPCSLHAENSETEKIPPGKGDVMATAANFTGIDMVLVPAGNLYKFWISRCEVTQFIYQSVMGNNPSYFKGESLPVEQVSWFNAVEFCNRLSARGGFNSYYNINKKKNDPENKNNGIRWTVTENNNADGFRLPTSAEWEYAARSGSSGKYFWGDKISGDYCWYKDNSGERTHPVGSKKPNAYGLFDMVGNVREWCFEWHPSFKGLNRVVRDGHYSLDPEDMRIDKSDSYPPHFEFGFIGIRLVKNK